MFLKPREHEQAQILPVGFVRLLRCSESASRESSKLESSVNQICPAASPETVSDDQPIVVIFFPAFVPSEELFEVRLLRENRTRQTLTLPHPATSFHFHRTPSDASRVHTSSNLIAARKSTFVSGFSSLSQSTLLHRVRIRNELARQPPTCSRFGTPSTLPLTAIENRQSRKLTSS